MTGEQESRLRHIAVKAEKSAIETRAQMAARIELRELLRADKSDQ